MPLKPPSLRLKVAVSFTALLTVVLAFSFLGLHGLLRSGLIQELDDNLREIAFTELVSANDGPDASPHVHSSKGEHQTLLYRRDGTILAASSSLSPEDREQFLNTALQAQPDAPFQAAGFRFFTLAQGSPDLLVAVRLPIDALQRRLNRISALLALVACSAVLMGGGLSYRLSRYLTAPIEELAELARHVAQGQVDRRARLGDDSSEVRALQDALNRMLDRLQQSLQALELRGEQQRQFVADASHELRNPVHALRGTLEVALRRPRSAEDYREALEIASREAVRLGQLVEDLFLITRAELDRLELQTVPLDLNVLIEECLQAHQAVARKNAVEFDYRAGQLPPVLADALRIRQVLDNLVDNALQHSPQDGRVALTALGSPTHLRVEVADQGPGLSPDQAAEVFQRFRQLDGSPARGLGLGLSVAHRLIQAHGGTVGARSAASGGSVFWFELPLIEFSSLPTRLVACPNTEGNNALPLGEREASPGEDS